MARITQVTDTAASSEAAALFSAIKGKIGMVPNLYRVAANQPAVLAGLLGLNDALGRGSFDARTREAIALASRAPMPATTAPRPMQLSRPD